MPEHAVVAAPNAPVGAADVGVLPGGAERRTAPRFSIEEPVTVHPLAGAAKLEAKITDLSVGGCRLEVDTRYLTGAMLRVELQFQVKGVVFRLLGVTAGRRTARSIGIRFVDLPERRKADLAEIIGEISAAEVRNREAGNTAVSLVSGVSMLIAGAGSPAKKAETAARAIPQKSEAGVKRENTLPRGGERSEFSARAVTMPGRDAIPGQHASKKVVITNQKAGETSKPSTTDRRAHQRHAVDTRAKLHLVKTGICMAGCIQDLSMAGCRLRTEEPFNVGIYVRVEAEFYLRGLPFRLGGVSQAIINKNTIGVRFLDMSERKRDQLAELIEEIGAQLARNAES